MERSKGQKWHFKRLNFWNFINQTWNSECSLDNKNSKHMEFPLEVPPNNSFTRILIVSILEDYKFSKCMLWKKVKGKSSQTAVPHHAFQMLKYKPKLEVKNWRFKWLDFWNFICSIDIINWIVVWNFQHMKFLLEISPNKLALNKLRGELSSEEWGRKVTNFNCLLLVGIVWTSMTF